MSKFAKAKIQPHDLSLKNLMERFKIWRKSITWRMTSRSLGAILLIFALIGIGYFIYTVPDGVDMPSAISMAFLGFIGLAGTFYATGEGHTFSGPVGIVRTFLVCICFLLLIFGPNQGERPILFEMIAVAFGRSLKE